MFYNKFFKQVFADACAQCLQNRVCWTISVESCFIISGNVIAQVFDLQVIYRADFRPAQMFEKNSLKQAVMCYNKLF